MRVCPHASSLVCYSHSSLKQSLIMALFMLSVCIQIRPLKAVSHTLTCMHRKNKALHKWSKLSLNMTIMRPGRSRGDMRGETHSNYHLHALHNTSPEIWKSSLKHFLPRLTSSLWISLLIPPNSSRLPCDLPLPLKFPFLTRRGHQPGRTAFCSSLNLKLHGFTLSVSLHITPLSCQH